MYISLLVTSTLCKLSLHIQFYYFYDRIIFSIQLTESGLNVISGGGGELFDKIGRSVE